ncbi:MAG: hypothetical protein CML24_09755 [Rhizobiales bacterium]|nr:hypothetical protein [Hyphomicrobiales bacterium]|tara:strand:+ start:4821 stop:5018 length:198 start_codon:yes stop_codon:yes gene_type:complete
MPDPKPTSDLAHLDEFVEAMRHPSPVEIEEMRRIGAQPGACGLDADGRLVVVDEHGVPRIVERRL